MSTLHRPSPLSDDAPVLVLFHGLEGSSHSHYARSTMRWFADRGWRGLVVHFRGCSGEANRLPRAYHSGDSAEGDWILRSVRKRWPNAPLYSVGISLGGNMLAKWAGELEQDASFVTAAASIGSPLDLAAGGAALGRGFNRIYTQVFLGTLKSKALAKLQQFPDLARDMITRDASAAAAICTSLTMSTRRLCTASATPTITGTGRRANRGCKPCAFLTSCSMRAMTHSSRSRACHNRATCRRR